MRKKWVKVINLLMMLVLLLSLVPSKASATESPAPETPKTENANTMTRSMITFFREDRTDLQLERVAADELRVYGVFMTNFFIPWSTKLKDMIDDSGKDSIPKQMSTKFFGSAEKATQMKDLNNKLYTPINETLGFDKTKFGMYKSNSAKDVMTGQDFYNKMAGVDDEPKVYNSEGTVLLDLSNKATQASLQVIFGFSPEYMISESKGLRKLDGLYMDGLGSVWGSYKGAAVTDYVLFLPAALNPVVFTKNPSTVKFPVANVFSMGGVLKVSEDFLSDEKYNVPYYNIRGKIPKTTYNKDNVVTIFGIQSATGLVGNTNAPIFKGVDKNPMSDVKDMLAQDVSSGIPTKNAHVMLTVDASKITNLDDYISKGNTLKVNQKSTLISYLLRTSVFTLEELADDMYYFNVPRAKEQNASGDNEGDFSGDLTDFILKQKLFAKETETKGEYEFYSKSAMPSPFNIFLDGYHNTASASKNKYLTDRGIKVKKDDKASDALKDFLDKGTWGNRDPKVITSAMKLLKTGDNPLVYGLVAPSTSSADIALESVKLLLWDNILSTSSTSFALGIDDSYLTVMSKAAIDDNFVTERKYNIDTKTPFGQNKKGGEIVSKDAKLTDNDVTSLSAFFHTAYSYRVFSANTFFASQLKGTAARAGSYTTPFGDAKMKNQTSVMNNVNNYAGMYWGYMVGMLDIKIKSDGKGFEEPSDYTNNHIPYMEISTLGGGLDLNEVLGASGVSASDANSLAEMQNDIIQKVYGILTDGPNAYRDKLIKSAQDSWLISTHRSITGSWVGNELSVSAGGSGSYASVVGYINTPSLNDLPLTDWILNDYMFVYMLLLLIVLIILVLMVITNMRTVREGILILILMMFVLILPQFLVSNVINISNSAGDKLYSERFNYWAITQHEQTVKTGKSAMITGDEMDYIVFQSMEASKNVTSTDVGVRVKWMSPKKDDVFDSIFNEKTTSQGLMANLTIFKWLFSSTLNQEEFVHNDPLATYLYRPYNAIAMEAQNSYNSLSSTKVKSSDVAAKVNAVSKNRLGLPAYRFSMLNKPAGTIKYTDGQKNLIASSGAYVTSKDKDKMLSYRFWALNNPAVTTGMFRSNYTTDAGISGDLQNPTYNAYSLTTESPFYYFYNVFKHRYSGDEAGFKSALLSKDLFKVTSPNPKMNNTTRDFLDMEGLFTYVIPYLHQGNEYVYGWTNLNGKDINGYDFNGVAPIVDSQDSKTRAKQQALLNKFNAEKAKKENLKRVWKLYTPWVDQLYSPDVLNQTVTVADKKTPIEDTMNPGAYDKIGRAMIFSEADMYAKSYRYSDLSDVERRIQATLDSTYTDMMYLTNYYDFDEEVLITAAAMTATFNFNKEFSDTKLLGESSILYPQSFELKNFNYDAFMRLLLLNATGEPLTAEKDLYERILDKTSLFTGIILLLSDLLAVIVIPTMKVVVLLLLLFLSIALSLSSVLTPPEKIVSTIFKNLGVPSLMFLGASIAFAYIISLFMGEGLTGYVGGRAPELGVSDPTVTMGLMVVVDCMYLYVLWKIIKHLIDALKNHTVSSFFSTVSLIAGAGTSLVNGVMDKAKGAYGKNVQGGHRKDMLDALKGAAAGGVVGAAAASKFGSSGESSSNSSDGGLNTPTLGMNNDALSDAGTKDDDFKDFIDSKSSKRHEDEATATTDRTIGHKIVDFKYDVKNKALDTVDTVKNAGSDLAQGVRDTGNSVKDSVHYATSRDGFRKDVKDNVKEVKTKTVNYTKDLSEYNTQRGNDERIKRQQQKNTARSNKEAIRRNRETLTSN